MSNHAMRDENNVPTYLMGVSSVDMKTPTPAAVDPVTGRVLVDVVSGGGTGTQYNVSGTCDGSNVTFTIPVAVGSDFLLWFERQQQFKTEDYTYVAAAGITTITYVAGHQPFNGATLHRAYVVS
jgi:hypothetical protein